MPSWRFLTGKLLCSGSQGKAEKCPIGEELKCEILCRPCGSRISGRNKPLPLLPSEEADFQALQQDWQEPNEARAYARWKDEESKRQAEFEDVVRETLKKVAPQKLRAYEAAVGEEKNRQGKDSIK
ncbi:hypothetical protein HYFRA_00010362 [Hymenoscyphus fraxineus]|uniref:Uncharacterized protein n=1 Tax=Hymenoscyphus fraxineus TaxID=746836 RepID=A0A9N9KW82_9HELO|nr:hypothetical protein HYFRA_00010362 [Hymenoscyphus fraxineus]